MWKNDEIWKYFESCSRDMRGPTRPSAENIPFWKLLVGCVKYWDRFVQLHYVKINQINILYGTLDGKRTKNEYVSIFLAPYLQNVF